MQEGLSYEEVERRCREIIAAKLGIQPEGVRPEDRLVDLGFDSMGIVDLMFEIEGHFSVTAPRDVPELQTRDDLRRLYVKDIVVILHRYQT